MRLSTLLSLGSAVSPVLSASCPLGHTAERTVSDVPSIPQCHSARGIPARSGKKGVMLMNRIGPSTSTLYISDSDGTNERQLLANSSTFDYHAAFSADGEYVTFTSERSGDGNADLYKVKTDGTGLELVLGTSSFEDSLVLQPNGTLNNIWIMDTTTKVSYNLTNTEEVKGVSWSPDGYFKPAWSPDGQWLAFYSDRNTNWTGHGNGTGWEHTQELSVYVIRPNGSDFRQLATKSGYCLGSPKWSLDGSRIVYHEITREDTWNAHRPEDLDTTDSQIVSVDFATGLDRVEETSGSGLKLLPQYISSSQIGYLTKGPTTLAGLTYTGNTSAVYGAQRNPAWSPDGKTVVYEKVGWTIRAMEKPLYSWDEDWEYRFTDVFPELSLQGRLAITQKQTGYANSSIVSMTPDGTDLKTVFDVYASGQANASLVVQGLAGAFQPAWSPDGEWIAFGLGSWFQERAVYTAYIYRALSNGSSYQQLTNGSINSGFPSYSHDGSALVYRVWGDEFGLRVLNLTTMETSVLTTESDNLPQFSPDGGKVVFTRKTNATNFDVCTISPDGTGLQVLMTSGTNDAHAVWTADGRIMYSSGMFGFRAEAATYDDTFQPYGQILVMNADGIEKTMLTDSMWEDSMPLYLPNEVLYSLG